MVMGELNVLSDIKNMERANLKSVRVTSTS